MKSFNVLDEPCIPVRTTAGERVCIGLREACRPGHEIRDFDFPLPSIVVAFIRLVEAIRMRALDGPATTDEWLNFRDSPDDLAARVDEYLDRHHDRFWLFDTETPFLQTPGLRTATGDVSDLSKLIADVPNGERLFAMRDAGSLKRIEPAEAFWWLVHAQTFDPSGIKSGAVGDPLVKGGKGYPQGVAFGGWLGHLNVEGADLQETLMMNLVPRELFPNLEPDLDLPPWELPPPDATHSSRPARGPVDTLTFPSRRILLHGDADGVTGVVISNGDLLSPHNLFDVEPYTAWRYSAPQTKKTGHDVYMPQEVYRDTQVWRGIAQILPKGGGTPREHPPRDSRLTEFLAQLEDEGSLHPEHPVRIRRVGVIYGSQSSVIDDVIDDDIAVPASLLDPTDLSAARLVSDMVGNASAGVAALQNLSANLRHAAGGDRAGGDASARGYAALDQPFREWLLGLGPTSDLDAERQAWHREARQILRSLADEYLAAASPAAWRGDLGGSTRGMDAPRADVYFHAALRKALPLPEDRQKKVG